MITSACYQPDTNITRLRNPIPNFPWPWKTRNGAEKSKDLMSTRMFSSAICFEPFALQLDDYIGRLAVPDTPWMRNISSLCKQFHQNLLKSGSTLWEDDSYRIYRAFDGLLTNRLSRDTLDAIFQGWNTSEDWLVENMLHDRKRFGICLRYHLRALLRVADDYSHQMDKHDSKINAEEAETTEKLLMKLYFEKCLPEVIAKCVEKGLEENEMKEFWVTMIFKGICVSKLSRSRCHLWFL